MIYQHETSKFSTPTDNIKIFFQRWIPENPRRGWNMIIQHGLGEHSSRYGNVLEAFADTGITIYALDSRGHGRSEGKRGHANSLDQLSQDLGYFFQHLKDSYDVSNPILYGHSLGGAIALNFINTRLNQWDISALVATASALKVEKNLMAHIKTGLGRILKKVAPALTLDSGLNLKSLANDPVVIENYKKDPLVHSQLSATLGLSVLDRGLELIAQADKVKIPIYLAHGQEDGITSPAGTVEYFEACGSKDKKLVIYPGLVHEIHNAMTLDKEKVLNDITTWVLAHLSEEQQVSDL